MFCGSGGRLGIIYNNIIYGNKRRKRLGLWVGLGGTIEMIVWVRNEKVWIRK